MPLNADRLQRIQDVIEEARTKAPEDRAAFVAEACGDDAEIRDEVQSLLMHADQAGEDFLRIPELGPRLGLRDAPTDEPDPLLGTRIGRYHIRSVIAAGGMGTVYLAEQDNPRREVALKVMTAGAFTTRSALRRFEYESQILAKLRHPNIAHVYEAGTAEVTVASASRGRWQWKSEPGASGEPPRTIHVPYFAMEYIPEAQSITRYAREHQLGLRERLDLFIRICDAVHHGHQKGVIHRDLKPGNILVDPAGEPKVIDFGVAKSTDSDVAVTTLRTDVGQIIGTLQYMSPEQCAADPEEIDTRSDVYSLGVVLYELLTERLPYDVSNMTLHSAARRICEQEPTKPSEFNRRLRGESETIILKAIEKDRAKRYQSTADLAADIRRYLNGEPISACAPTSWTRAMRWAARHPVVTTSAACLLIAALSLAGTVIGVWWLNMRPDRIEVDKDLRCVRLMSKAGRELHMWPPGAKPGEDNVRNAVLIDRPESSGGGKLAVVGYHFGARSEFAGHLCAYDLAGDLDEPIWQGRIENEYRPEDQKNRPDRLASQCNPQFLMTADVFPEAEGKERQDEIVAVFCNGDFSQRAIRIYDTAGNLLYQLWQDGGVNSLCWLSDPGLLILAGADEQTKERAQAAGDVDGPRGQIVFAIRPFLGKGSITNEYMERQPKASSHRPVWYKYIHPLRSETRDFTVRIQPPVCKSDQGRRVSVLIEFAEHPEAKFTFLIDGQGHEVPETRVPTDKYKERVRKHELPSLEVFTLSDEPPTR